MNNQYQINCKFFRSESWFFTSCKPSWGKNHRIFEKVPMRLKELVANHYCVQEWDPGVGSTDNVCGISGWDEPLGVVPFCCMQGTLRQSPCAQHPRGRWTVKEENSTQAQNQDFWSWALRSTNFVFLSP